MSVQIRLLGRPRAWRDGEDVALRGHKAWLVLAVLLLVDAPVGRERLMRLLFVDAADPAAALRWNLWQLRRALGLRLDGDPVAVDVPNDVRIDVDLLMHGDANDAATIGRLDDDLLTGVRVEPASEVEVWLDDERRRIHHLGVDVRREAALARLGRSQTDAALALARQVAESSPLEEDAAALLVRCLRACGRAAEARTVAERVASRLRDHLGVEASDQLWAALATPPGGDRRVTGRGAVTAQLEAGTSAVSAGAIDTGVAMWTSRSAPAARSDTPTWTRCSSIARRPRTSVGCSQSWSSPRCSTASSVRCHPAPGCGGTTPATTGSPTCRAPARVLHTSGTGRARPCARAVRAPGGWGHIVDTACGAGVGVVRLAEHYPQSQVIGVDGDGHSLDRARSLVGHHGLGSRVSFVDSPLEDMHLDLPAALSVNNISMHECRDIDKVAARVLAALEPGGWFVISDFPFPDTVEGLRAVPLHALTWGRAPRREVAAPLYDRGPDAGLPSGAHHELRPTTRGVRHVADPSHRSCADRDGTLAAVCAVDGDRTVSTLTHRIWMDEALAEARAAEAHDDVPVGAVVVRDGQVVARAHNERERRQDPTAHAEILALRAAAQAVGSWRLELCALYVTLEPCAMCAGAVVLARVPLLVFGATDPKAGAVGSLMDLPRDERLNHRATVVGGIRADECAGVLTQFFHRRRAAATTRS